MSDMFYTPTFAHWTRQLILQAPATTSLTNALPLMLKVCLTLPGYKRNPGGIRAGFGVARLVATWGIEGDEREEGCDR